MNNLLAFLFGPIHLHKWSKWKVTDEKKITRGDNSVIGDRIVQKRECLSCGYTQISQQISTI